ncbi:MAG: PLP-dependent aminotransferase family protein [Phyllobacteriaceae bacterium]|nr:PLP-dependent aminotransferase family protein [Phyllobacteriaceae bacterium]
MTIWTPVLDRSKPLYLAIADAISHDVDGGTLPEGARLPPQRELAWKLGVTLGTVTRAYKEAEERGLLSGEVGRGSYIRRARLSSPLPSPSTELAGLVDLSHAIPPPIVTSAEFDAAMAAIQRDPRKLDLLDYAPPDGFPQHKTMAATWLKRSGIEVAEQNIVITAGAHLGFTTVLEAISEPGETVLAESVNYALLRTTFRNAHVTPVPIAMDEDGMLPDALDHAARSSKSRILYIVPSLQNPTTNTMSRRRRDALVAMARRHDLTIIEDDIFRLLDERTQPPTFYALAPERTFHVTSLSKTLAPGLRIGIVVTPANQERALKSHVRNMASRNVGITGEIARFWIETDLASTILTRVRNELAARRNVFLQVFKGTPFRCEPGAPYAWLELPEQWQAGRFVRALAARRVRVTPGSAFLLDGTQASRHVRVCFGGPDSGVQTRKALELMRELMAEEPEDDFTPVA